MSFQLERPAAERKARHVREPELLREAILAVQGGNRVKARFHLRLVVRLHPNVAAAWHLLGQVVETAAERIECLSKAVMLDPRSAESRAALLAELVAGHDFPAALRVDPTHLPALLGAAAVATPVEAVGLYGRVLAVDPDNAVARAGMLACIRPPAAGHTCPLCQSARDPAAERCPRCRAVLSLADPHAFHGPTRCDVEVVAAAVARLERTGVRTADDVLHLGLAHLNLGHEDAGTRRLKELVARPDVTPVVRERVNRLLDHLRGAKSTVRMTRPGPADPFAPLVLVADDNPVVRAVAASTLGMAGYRTVCVCDGTEVDAAIRLEGVPALVVLAVHMPCLGGHAVSKGLKQNPRTKDVPVLFLTGSDGLMDKLRNQWSAADHLAKPFKASALVAAVTKRVPLLPPPQPPADTVLAEADGPTKRIRVQPRG